MTELLPATLAAIFLALAAHPFVTYPLSLALFARRRTGLPDSPPEPLPSFSICVCAYNEEAAIEAKAENLLALKRGAPNTEILVYIDAATDRTAERLSAYAHEMTIVHGTERAGKTAGMRTLAGLARGDILVFSDANVLFAEDALPQLARGFADPHAGCVCGRLVYTNGAASATATVGAAYWRVEEAIKRIEDRAGTLVSADGSIFAVRRRLYPAIPDDIIDDFAVSLTLLCDGYRIRRVEDAVATEASATRSADEYRRKIRIACQAFNVHRLLWPRLVRAGWGVLYRYVSHKLLRWFMGPLLLAAGLAGAVAAGLAWGWAPVAIAVAGGLAGLALGAWLRASPALLLVEAFAAMLATALGIARSLRGDRFQIWTPAASVRETATRHGRPIRERRIKRAFDVVGASALLVLFAPLMAAIAILVRRDGGPVLFGHRRIGAGGRPFQCLKFRTMRVDADAALEDLLASDPAAREEWRRSFKLRSDPRVTPLGRALRRSSLDELPQLFNVLRGDMSLVGPRPIVEAEVAFYDRSYPFYIECRPGMTGLWQISGRSDVDYARRVALDRDYVTSWSIVRDLVILLRTPATVLWRRGAY